MSVLCQRCKIQVGLGGVVQEDGRVLCLFCDTVLNRVSKIPKKYDPRFTTEFQMLSAGVSDMQAKALFFPLVFAVKEDPSGAEHKRILELAHTMVSPVALRTGFNWSVMFLQNSAYPNGWGDRFARECAREYWPGKCDFCRQGVHHDERLEDVRYCTQCLLKLFNNKMFADIRERIASDDSRRAG